MSGSTSLVSTALTDAERDDVRDFCGYPAYGDGNSGFQGWRYFQPYGVLEYRMSNMAPGQLQKARQYLADLYALKAAVPASSANLDTDQAAVWHHNRDEVAHRMHLYDTWRRQLIAFLGVPPGPALSGASGMNAIII